MEKNKKKGFNISKHKIRCSHITRTINNYNHCLILCIQIFKINKKNKNVLVLIQCYFQYIGIRIQKN